MTIGHQIDPLLPGLGWHLGGLSLYGYQRIAICGAARRDMFLEGQLGRAEIWMLVVHLKDFGARNIS
jgi:hypothetical protein